MQHSRSLLPRARPCRANLRPIVPYTSRRRISPSLLGNLIPSPSSIKVSHTSINSVSCMVEQKVWMASNNLEDGCANVVHPSSAGRGHTFQAPFCRAPSTMLGDSTPSPLITLWHASAYAPSSSNRSAPPSWDGS